LASGLRGEAAFAASNLVKSLLALDCFAGIDICAPAFFLVATLVPAALAAVGFLVAGFLPATLVAVFLAPAFFAAGLVPALLVAGLPGPFLVFICSLHVLPRLRHYFISMLLK
jgi:hypothetical protein